MATISTLKSQLNKTSLPTPFAPLCRWKAGREIEGRMKQAVQANWRDYPWGSDRAELLTPPRFASYIPLAPTKLLAWVSCAGLIGLGGWTALAYLKKPPIPKMPAHLWNKKWPALWGFFKSWGGFTCLNVRAGTGRAFDQVKSQLEARSHNDGWTLDDMTEKAKELSYPWTFQDAEGLEARLTAAVVQRIIKENLHLRGGDFDILLPVEEKPPNWLMQLSIAAACITSITWIGINGYGLYRLANKMPLPLLKTIGVEAVMTGAAALALQQHLKATSDCLVAELR